MISSTGIILGLLTMLGFGMSNALSRIPAQKIGGLRTIFYRGLGLSIVQLLILVFLFPSGITKQGIAIAIAVAIFSYLPIMFFYKGLQIGKVGIMSPIANSSAIFTTLLATIFLGETLQVSQLTSGLVVVFGILLISINFRDFKNSHLFNLSSGAPYALAACILWGITFFLFKYPVSMVGPILTSFVVEFAILILCATHMRIKKEDFSLPIGYGKYFTGIIFFSVVGPLAYNYGIQTSSVSLMAMLYMANPLIATTYARFAYGEKLSLQQYAGIGLVILGVVGISVLK